MIHRTVKPVRAMVPSANSAVGMTFGVSHILSHLEKYCKALASVKGFAIPLVDLFTGDSTI